MLQSYKFSNTAAGVRDSKQPMKVDSVTFLVTVNDTWYPDEYNKTCMETVMTPALRPGVKYNESMQIHVGDCDHGPLMFTLSDDGTVYACNQFVYPLNFTMEVEMLYMKRCHLNTQLFCMHMQGLLMWCSIHPLLRMPHILNVRFHGTLATKAPLPRTPASALSQDALWLTQGRDIT